MSRHERRMYFESLCYLRDRYADRSADDSTVALSIEDAMAWAEVALLNEPLLDPLPADEPKP